jgi:GntR family transcriptional repressor for pyruvate dehydrogenase complex
LAYTNNATDEVFNFIVNKIRSEEWLPDSRIWSEKELCDNLGVSRVAVRQAINRLETMSVLRKVQGSGTYVEHKEKFSILGLPILTLNKDSILSLMEFRRSFDSNNVALFIQRASDEEIEELEKNYENMVNSADDSVKFHYYDYEFHYIIARGTRNPFIIKIYDIFMNILENHQRLLYKSAGPQIGIQYHKDILKNIKERNSELASIYTRQHIDLSIEGCKKYFAEHADIVL